MGKERLSAAAISLRTVTAPIRHWVPAASRTKSFRRQRQGIRGQLVPLASNKVVRVRVKFLVGLDGQVETTEIITRNIPDLGFKEAAVEAVKRK